MRNINFEVRVDMRGMAAENDDTVGEDDGFFDIVSNDENRARGNLLTEPELEELAAEGFRREDVKRGERLVHKEHFGLDDERSEERRVGKECRCGGCGDRKRTK